MRSLVELRGLSVRYSEGPIVFPPVTIQLKPGQRVGIAGESGCGKTTLLKAVVGLLPAGASIVGTCDLRGRAGYIPQRALASLSPFLTVGEQVTELTRSAQRTAELLALVGLAEARFQKAYPHQLSGGERQRVLAVQALALRPDVIVADEPTANLDPEREQALLELIDRQARETGAAILVSSHRESVFQKLQCEVLRLTPSWEGGSAAVRPAWAGGKSLVDVRGLSKTYRRRDWLTRSRPAVRALEEISLQIGAGECVVLCGPSGAGKSTLALCLAGRETWDSGSIEWHSGRLVQLVQQEASESLNPRMSIREALQEACGTADAAWLEQVRLPREWIDRRSGELSEGQRARVAILRAAASLEGGLLILDESLAGLDPETRSHILAYLRARQEDQKLSLLVVTHDLDVGAELNARVVRL